PRALVGDGLSEWDPVPREIHGIPPECGPPSVDCLLQSDRLSEQLRLVPTLVAPGVDGAEGAEEAGALGRYRQAGLSDDALTVVPAQPEIEERVFDDLVGFPPSAVGAMDFVD